MNWYGVFPFSQRFIDYYLENKNKKNLKLADILEYDLNSNSYIECVVALALQGYKLKLIAANTKIKRSIGAYPTTSNQYSYYKLEKSDLISKLEKKIWNLEKENLELKDLIKKNESLQNNKAGQKSFDNVDIIQKIFQSYESGKSLGTIASQLNNNNVKTKRGGKWHKSTVKYILDNKEYVNLGYITKSKYEKIQNLLRSK